MQKNRPLPKSLHTVTCIVNVAREFMKGGASMEYALFRALFALGIEQMTDEHMLIKQARAKLAKG